MNQQIEQKENFAVEYVKYDSNLFSKAKKIPVTNYQIINQAEAKVLHDITANMESMCLRIGIFCAELAKYRKNSVIGVMITALGHTQDPFEHDRLRILDQDGNILSSDLKQVARAFINEIDLHKGHTECIKTMGKIFSAESVNENPLVFISCDSQPSSATLSSILSKGVLAGKSNIYNFGMLTYSQMYFAVRYINSHYKENANNLKDLTWVLQEYSEYFGGLFSEFFCCLKGIGYLIKNYHKVAVIDCANGIGILQLSSLIDRHLKNHMIIYLINHNDIKYTSQICGSDYVLSERKKPADLDKIIPYFKEVAIEDISFVSLNQDGDRAIYYQPKLGSEDVVIINGDKLSALYSLWLISIFKVIKEDQKIISHGNVILNEDFSKWHIGVITTPYTNGAARRFYEDLGLGVVVEKADIDSVHKAAEKFDIAICYDSTGYGDIFYQPKKLEIIKNTNAYLDILSDQQNKDWSQEIKNSIKFLRRNLRFVEIFLALTNQGFGDGVSSFLMIECALAYLKFKPSVWNELYTDFPSINIKIQIKNMSAIKISEDGTTIEEPKEIKDRIDLIKRNFHKARVCLYPFNIEENELRLYVEAEEKYELDYITDHISKLILDNKQIS